jgi:hypothetical protein
MLSGFLVASQAIGVRVISFQISLYADDLVLFISPVNQDFQMVHNILLLFQGPLALVATLASAKWPP